MIEAVPELVEAAPALVEAAPALVEALETTEIITFLSCGSV